MIEAAILLFLAVISFAVYLTPTPVSRASVLHFLQFFLFQWILLAGFFMAGPYVLGWRLPLQQGLGSSPELLVRGLLLSSTCVFSIVVTRMQADGALRWIKAFLLLLVGVSEFSWVWDFMDSSVNGVLNALNMPMNALYAIIFPYILLLGAYVLSFCLGAAFLVSNTYRAFKKA